MKMRIYFNAFWNGFLEKTNQMHVQFFLDLFKRAFNQECIVSTIKDADVLVESVFGPSVAKSRPWTKRILFTGEPYERDNIDDYDALIGAKELPKTVFCPLFVAYTWCSHPDVHYNFPSIKDPKIPPITAICVIITNPYGKQRNRCLDRMQEANIPIFYAGKFRNNGTRISYPFGSSMFIRYLKQFRFVACLENAQQDHYMTEKIFHGFLAGTVPIYFGSRRITDYFNEQRFVNIQNPESNDWINQIQELMMDDDAYLKMCQAPVYKEEQSSVTIDTVAEDLKKTILSA